MKPAIKVEELTKDERLALIEELWDSLDEADRDALELTEAQREELDRRLDRLEREGPSGISPDELRERLNGPS